MVQTGTLFGYLTAFVTIVLAIAVGDLATSFHRLLRARRRVKWDPLPLVVAFWVLLVILTMFFAMWNWTHLTGLTFYGLLWKTIPLFLYFLAASAALPDEVPVEGVDLGGFYFSERRYFFSVMIFGFVTDTAASVIDGWPYMSSHPGFLWGFFAPLALGTFASLAVMLWRSERWIHWLGISVLLVIAHIGFASWAVSGASALAG